jgi:hypothetical protein
MSWDNVYSLSQFFAVFFAAVALVSGLIVNKRQGKEIAQLRESTETQKGETAKANKSAAEANERAERARKETAEIYRKLGRRYITKAESAAFAEAMKGQPKPDLLRVVVEDTTSAEDMMFRYALIRMLVAAGIKCEPIEQGEWYPNGPYTLLPNGTLLKPPMFPGLRLELRIGGGVEGGPWFFPLLTAFETAQIETTMMPVTSGHPNLVPENGGIVVIGPKPDPTFEPPGDP